MVGQSPSANDALDAVSDWLHKTAAYSETQEPDANIVIADILSALGLLEHAQRAFIKEMNQVLNGSG